MPPHEKGVKRHENAGITSLKPSSMISRRGRGSGRWKDPPLPFRDRQDRRADGKPMNRIDAYRMVRRCTADAGFKCPAPALIR
jgi:hypothetical protein